MNYTKEERQLLDEKYAGVASEAFETDRKRLASGEPLAYVIGWQPFLGLNIYLDSHPLIPRPETEDWSEALCAKLSEMSPRSELPSQDLHAHGAQSIPGGGIAGEHIRVLDLCAGSGAIGCAVLKHVPHAEVWFSELDEAHVATIQKNIEQNGLDASRAHIVSGDLFAPLQGEKFSVIATNPPYIPEGRSLEDSVRLFEPHVALFAGADGLSLIRRIAESAKEYLLPGGQVWLECDSEHVEAAVRCFWGLAERVDIRKDQYGRPRVIVGYYM